MSFNLKCLFNGNMAYADHTRHLFVAFSLLASAVGSQASITASFSIINQCLALGCFPRTKVIHTSDTIHGQVYIPDVNWVLMILSLSVTIGFQDINRIGYAAGLLYGCMVDHKFSQYAIDMVVFL